MGQRNWTSQVQSKCLPQSISLANHRRSQRRRRTCVGGGIYVDMSAGRSEELGIFIVNFGKKKKKRDKNKRKSKVRMEANAWSMVCHYRNPFGTMMLRDDCGRCSDQRNGSGNFHTQNTRQHGASHSTRPPAHVADQTSLGVGHFPETSDGLQLPAQDLVVLRPYSQPCMKHSEKPLGQQMQDQRVCCQSLHRTDFS